MFKNEGNYEFFLKRYDDYLSEFVDTYAYCLLGNHFHLLVQVREMHDLTTFKKLTDLSVHDSVSHQFRKFFQSYAMAFNKQHDRVGTLFQTPFKRALVNNDSYFTKLVYYIHANPQQHGLTNDFKDWKWSSYNNILSEKTSKLKKQEVINWFGDKEYYVQCHSDYQKALTYDSLLLDDD